MSRSFRSMASVWHQTSGTAAVCLPPSTPARAAMKVPGVEEGDGGQGLAVAVQFQPLGGVAVIARNTGAAIKGRDALKVVWDDGANAKYDSRSPTAPRWKTPPPTSLVVRKEGDVDAALKSADGVTGLSIICRISPVPAWSRRSRLPTSRATRPRSGRRCRAPVAPGRMSPRRSASPKTMSSST